MIKKYSLCLTNYNRTVELMRAFEKVEDDPRIAEIVISDDDSTEETKQWLSLATEGNPKIKLHFNKVNMGMLSNKYIAVGLASLDKVILFDSDNLLDTAYLDALDAISMEDGILYLPEFAKPEFDYRAYAGQTFDRHSAGERIDEPMFNCMLNTCNYAFRKQTYLEVFKPNTKMRGTDTLWIAYLWLSAGYKMHVVPGMQYLHTIHPGSGWLKDATYNSLMADELKAQIKELAHGN